MEQYSPIKNATPLKNPFTSPNKSLSTASSYSEGDYSCQNFIDIKQALMEQTPLLNYFDSNKLTTQMRNQMLNWLIEVTSSYECNPETFFSSAHILDQYYCNSHDEGDYSVYLVGICSLFIASKLHDTNSISLDKIVNKISHGDFQRKDIIKKEREIIRKVVRSDLMFTLYNTVSDACLNLFELNDPTLNKVTELSGIVSKFCMFDLNLMLNCSQVVIGVCSALVAMDMLKLTEETCNLEILYNLGIKNITEIKKSISELISKFESKHPQENNIYVHDWVKFQKKYLRKISK